MPKEADLSIVILNYNTRQLLKDCLGSLEKVKGEEKFEVIVSDNGSEDGSVDMVKNDFPWVQIIENEQNLGFAAGNNKAKPYCRGSLVLFLNSDTIVKKGTLKETIRYMRKHKDIGALTCKLVLENGEIDKDVRRSFPTPWVAITHFSLIDRVFKKSKIFSKYWYGYLPYNQIQKIDVIQGAYFLTRRSVLDKVGWFDEDYFLDGEDIDLCWKIKKSGWKIIYYPNSEILHLKGATKGKTTVARKNVPLGERIKFVMAGVNSMEIFYRKRLWNEYPLLINFIVLFGISIVKLVRLSKLVVFK